MADPIDFSAWVASKKVIRHIGTNGAVVKELALNALGLDSQINAIALSKQTDITPPTIAITFPSNGAVVNISTPTIHVEYSDDRSGIDEASYRTVLDGTDTTAGSIVTPTNAYYTVTSSLAAGEHVAIACIADRAGNTSCVTNRFTVTVFRAIADCTPLTGSAPLRVTFRSRGEFSGGTIVRYRWDFEGDGVFDTSDPVARDYTFTYQRAGTYHPVLEVKNNLDDIATDTRSIVVIGSSPTVVANALPSNGQIPLTVNFSAVASDPDGNIVLYEWDFEGDGIFDFSSPTSGNTTHIYTQTGIFIAVCRVTDNDGHTATARTTTTVIRSGGSGTPSVIATATPSSGNAPLAVSFNGSATDDGTIVKWEWDFNGDGTYDYMSPTSPAISFTYTNAGIFAAALRVTDNTALTSIANVEIIVNLIATLSIPDDTFDPSVGETAAVVTSINAPAPVRIILKDRNGSIVRTLINRTRLAGTYTDPWDGRNDQGDLLPQAPYFAVLQYQVGSEPKELDLTASTGGVRYNPPRNNLFSTPTFNPFEDDFLTINFTIPPSQGASEIQAFIGLFFVDTRFITLLDRVPLGVGTHTIYWDGIDANGNFAVAPPGDSFLFGIFGFTLPDNAIFIQSAPDISNVSVDPNFFDPTTGNLLTPGDPVATVTYDLSKLANVELTVTSLATGRILRHISLLNVAAGTAKTIQWDGRADNGILVGTGNYRLALTATDSTGSSSITRYALMRIFY